MKIAEVCPYDFSRPGGVKSHIENLALYLAKMGHEVKIIAPNVNSDLITDKRVKLIGKNRSTNLWGGTKIDMNIARGPEVEELKIFLEEEQFDVIHFHNGWTPFMSWQVAYHSRSKIVWTFHDTPADNFISKKVVGKYVMPAAAKYIQRFADELISVSKSQASYVERWLKPKPEIIPNGINLSDFTDNHEPIEKYKDGKFNLLFLGRFEERKGLFHTLEAYKRLQEKYGNLRLLIAGDGDQKEAAHQFVADHNLKDVEFLGFVDEEIKGNLIATADIFLATALYGESFGIVLLEAMACGTAIAGYGNEGYLNVVPEPWNEFFPTPRDTDTLTDKIEKLYLDNDLRQKMIDWGLKEVHKYEWSHITAQVEKVMQRALRK